MVHSSISLLEIPMTVLTRWLPWSAALLPRRAAAAPPAAVPPVAPVAAPASLPEEQRAALAERRAQALRSMFPMLYSLCARRADLWRAIAIERYLSQATNIADLELRIQEIQRQRHFGWSI